jgi:predicted dehydrogenase
MKNKLNRREFIKTSSAGTIGLGVAGSISSVYGLSSADQKRIGIIGLDTSHSTAFTKALNDPAAGPEFSGYKVVAAYPKGSLDIKSSTDRIPAYTEEVRKSGVEIVDSIEELLKRVDFVMLETNDGRRHLEQALIVIKAGKPLFVDKPVAASLSDTIAIFQAARKYNVPLKSSGCRYLQSGYNRKDSS